MSALPPRADMLSVGINVCFVPEADICSVTNEVHGRATLWDQQRIHALDVQVCATSDQQISLLPARWRGRSSLRCGGYNVWIAFWGWFCKLWRGRTTFPEVFETARDASKATAKVACGCEL